MIRRHGGKIVVDPGKYHLLILSSAIRNFKWYYNMIFLNHSGQNTFAVIADNQHVLNVATIIAKKRFNVVKPQWVERAFGSGQPLTKLIEFTHEDMLYTNEPTKRKFQDQMKKMDEEAELENYDDLNEI